LELVDQLRRTVELAADDRDLRALEAERDEDVLVGRLVEHGQPAVEVLRGRGVGVGVLGAAAGEEVERSALALLGGGDPGLAGLLEVLDDGEDAFAERFRLRRLEHPVGDPAVQPALDRFLEEALRRDADVVVDERELPAVDCDEVRTLGRLQPGLDLLQRHAGDLGEQRQLERATDACRRGDQVARLLGKPQQAGVSKVDDVGGLRARESLAVPHPDAGRAIELDDAVALERGQKLGEEERVAAAAVEKVLRERGDITLLAAERVGDEPRDRLTGKRS
jgi:hypothetical protein